MARRYHHGSAPEGTVPIPPYLRWLRGFVGTDTGWKPERRSVETFEIVRSPLREGLAAIDAPMFHTDHMPSSFWPRSWQPASLTIEARLPANAIAALRRKGHQVNVTEDWSQGRLSAVARFDGVLKAAANPRGMQGYAVGR